jgi:thymidylate synthase ThyX
MLSNPHTEIQELAKTMKEAARNPSWNVNHETYRTLVEAIRAKDETLGELAEKQLLRDVRVSPTLVKYAEANAYEMETRHELQQAAAELMKSEAVATAPEVDLLDEEPLEIELATTLLYEQSHYPYRQLRDAVKALSAARREEMVDIGLRHRGRHDELMRAYCAGQRFRFDILMDIGGYRDMHRHRRCTQIIQDYTTAHGYDTPVEITEGRLTERYNQLMSRMADAAKKFTPEGSVPTAPGWIAPEAQYFIPLAYRKRALFKMDFAEVVYISELRTTPAGHWSYRNVAYKMFEAVQNRYPSLARYFRVTDVREPVDLLKR